MDLNPVSAAEDAAIEHRIHAKTIITILAVNFSYMAQIIGVVGAGNLAQAMGELINSPSQTVWYSSLLTIFTVALCPSISQAADYWGRKWFVVVLSASGVVGSIIISRAENFGTIIAGFTLLGLSYGSQGLLLAITSEVLARRYRPISQAVSSIAANIGVILAVLLCGGLIRHGNVSNSRIFWYVEAGIFALATVGLLVGYNPPPRELQLLLKTREKLTRLDWIGYALFAPGLALFSMALSWSENPYTWKDAHILGPFVIGIIMVITFMVYEWRFKEGMLHHGLWRHRNFALSLLIIFAEGLAYFSANSYFVYEITVIFGDDRLIASANYCILFLVTGAFTNVFAYWSFKRKSLKTPLLVGCVFFIVFFICMATTDTETTRASVWAYPIFAGIGFAAIIPLTTVAAQLATAPELISTATSLMMAARSLGGTVGLAVNNSIFNSAMGKEVPAKISAATLPLGLPPSSLPSLIQALSSGNQEAVFRVPNITPAIAEAGGKGLQEAYAIAFRNAWIASASFGAPMLIAAFFIRNQSEEFNNIIEAPVEDSILAQSGKMLPPPEFAQESANGQEFKDTGAQHHETIEKTGV